MSGVRKATRSWATVGGFVTPVMTGTIAFGCDAAFVGPAGRPSPSCPIGWRRRRHYTLHCRQQACEHIAAGETAEQAAPHCKDPTRLPDPSTVRRWVQRRLTACGAGSRAECNTRTFCSRPPSLPGISARSAVFCPSRQEVHESSSSRRVETADSTAGLSASP